MRNPGAISLPARERVKLVRSLQCVDAAVEAVDEDTSVAATLRLLHPDVFANGGGQKPNPKEYQVCAELGIQMLDGLGVQMLSLTPYTQHYDWGKPRDQSIIAALTGQQNAEHGPDESAKPFAEMWMGDHPSGPSSVESPKMPYAMPQSKDLEPNRSNSLKDVLKRTPSMLGEQLSANAQLPFLLKVLSIHKALSIQAHPDKALATKLHRERPEVYKDPNHKPEIAIALTDDFQALCGFRRVHELVEVMQHVPELVAMVGEEAAKGLRESAGCDAKESAALKAAYSTMMHRSDDFVRDQMAPLLARAKDPPAPVPDVLKGTFELVSTLYDQYGSDIGIFSVFFMNHVHMKVGECLYMAQNVPHAYLSGDIVECMACSDNVVRGGLTPKYKDLEVLCEMLNYRGGPPAVVKPLELETGMRLYADPDIEEFQVTHMHLPTGSRKRRIFSSEGPAVAFVCQGSGSVTISGDTQEIGPGKVFMLAAGVEPEVTVSAELDIFVACCPPQYFKPTTRKFA
eukprot:TRINITY_DN43283_c0_g1_i1.p1 TRINITY_DN43283_c0_g1~~TRINITY_DN43283_c0_g1_i1.p1  ORF type:complete len:565 (-),score=103.75 TRINITY_DN43283_c0_g1_i1:111-1652(-)